MKIDDINIKTNNNNNHQDNPFLIAVYQLFNNDNIENTKRLFYDFDKIEQLEKEKFNRWKEKCKDYIPPVQK